MTHIFKSIKASKKPTPSNPTAWDAGACGKANMDRLREEPATDYDPTTGRDAPNPNGVKRKRRETWVDRYARKGKLSKDQQAAAQNLYAAWAGHPARDPLAAIIAKVDGKGNGDPMAAYVDQRRAFYAMWAKVPQSARPYIEHVVLNDLSIRTMNGCNGRSEPAYMQRLCAGLNAIC